MKFSSKENINILTSLLLKHGVDTAVICPGARNAPIASNLLSASMNCFPVTDERSAGFCALGLSIAKKQPVVVCVTSGSALLNLIPAVAEAYYQHFPIIVISADRPVDRIGQLCGQTIPQLSPMADYTAFRCSLPEPTDSQTKRYCERLVNEALIHASASLPVQINVPISEPLFNFSVDTLPETSIIKPIIPPTDSCECAQLALNLLDQSKRPIIILGQCKYDSDLSKFIDALQSKYVVLHESLSSTSGGMNLDLISDIASENNDLYPETILYIGGTLVSNKIKNFISSIPNAKTIGVSVDGEVHDTFKNQAFSIECEPVDFLKSISKVSCRQKTISIFKKKWDKLIKDVEKDTKENSHFSVEAQAVKLLEDALDGKDVNMHYANSTSVRLGNLYSHHYNYVNRGLNGIEGSLSTSAGFSLGVSSKTFCIIGDLSFFYDCNALWNVSLDGRLRIMLLNNHGGKIFNTLPGAKHNPGFQSLIKASHDATAEGICDSFNIKYIGCSDAEALPLCIDTLINIDSQRPVLLEITIN